MTHNTPADMRREAMAQARHRANREGEPMRVWMTRSGGTWYVRSEAEGKPDDAILVQVVVPEPPAVTP